MTVTTPTTPSLREVAESGGNPLRLKRIHHVEFWVGNAKQAAFFYRKAFGFSQLAYSRAGDGEPGVCVVRAGAAEGAVRALDAVRSGACGERAHPAAWGWGARHRALVEDADFAYHEAVRRGAERGGGAARSDGRAGDGAAGGGADVRGHDPFVPELHELRRSVSAGVHGGGGGGGAGGDRGGGSRGRQRRAGCDGDVVRVVLAASWASRATSRSTTRTSTRSTRR